MVSELYVYNIVHAFRKANLLSYSWPIIFQHRSNQSPLHCNVPTTYLAFNEDYFSIEITCGALIRNYIVSYGNRLILEEELTDVLM